VTDSRSPWDQTILFSTSADDEDEKNLWATPPEVFGPLHSYFNYTLDAAARADSAKVPNYIGPDHEDPMRRDAFSCDWSELSGGRPVFLNPPYGRGIERWIQLAHHQGQRVQVHVLTFARTDTGWWWRYVLGRDPKNPTAKPRPCASMLIWIPGRVLFLDPATGEPRKDKHGRPQSAPAPSVVVEFRPGYGAPWPVNLAWGGW
jgi:phage N-6-adenine-methyltransferase